MTIVRQISYSTLAAAADIPRGWGLVRHYELSIEIAPIPLNVVFRCWHLCYWWLVRGGPQARTLAERSFEAGLKEGIKTGRSQMRAEMYCDLGEVGRALRSVAFMEGWLDDHR